MKRLMLALLGLSLLMACEPEEESAPPPSLYNFRVNGELVIDKLHLHQSYQFSFGAADENNLRRYRLELINGNTNQSYLLKDEEIRGRDENHSDLFKFENTEAPLEPGYSLKLTIINSAGLSRSLSKDLELRDAQPALNVSLADPNQRFSSGDAVPFSGWVSDREDLQQLEIFIYREEDPDNPRMGTLIHDFTGSHDTLFHLGPEDKITLPNNLMPDDYWIIYRVSDSNGNARIMSSDILLDF